MAEKDILKSVKYKLDDYKDRGIVLNWERINCGKVELKYGGWYYGAKAGFPDIFAEIIVGKIIHNYYIETKNPTNGVHRDKQIEFQKKHTGFDNVYYELVIDCLQVINTIERISGYTKNTLANIDF